MNRGIVLKVRYGILLFSQKWLSQFDGLKKAPHLLPASKAA